MAPVETLFCLDDILFNFHTNQWGEGISELIYVFAGSLPSAR